ncbi:alpha-dextran endo-1,6-alpha-glucosidase [Solitalea longa]|uniref:Alpha-dextran endo-1,6-alpha-glucosidase n=1 Tax=Solitalea longa TaxID=2079460 RepID=A0A2S5A791_9SPHI|nr:alpha/beta hydrolase-fold protein [Solitalea longa]POY38394.1 alpha-dextran endo-1,6-alpha-glucosidase [Solitalea longa]
MQKRILLLAFFLFLSILCNAQLTVHIQSVPENTSSSDKLYLAGNFNGWNPGDSNYCFKRKANGTYSLTADLKPGKYEFKVTRGTWDKVEVDSLGNSKVNRYVEVNGDTEMIIDVDGWSDTYEKEMIHTASANVRLVDSVFYIPQLKTHRRVWIYLPKSYFDKSVKKKRYPVLYMQDGQNLFDDFYAPYGEWNVDETLDSLNKELIVVGIDHGGKERLNDYSPYQNLKYGGGNGNLYLEFMVNTLRPYINEHYRTLKDVENTGIMGSSMGGLISFYGGLKYDKVFGKIGVFSPSFWFHPIIYSYAAKWKPIRKTHLYILAGEKESDSLVYEVRKMESILRHKGLNEEQLKVVFKPDGRHAEWFWRREFADAINYLFPESQNITVVRKLLEKL